jgi:hypothetical protein
MPLIEKTDRIMNVTNRERHLRSVMRRMRDISPALLLTTASQRVATTMDIKSLSLNPPNINYHTIELQ